MGTLRAELSVHEHCGWTYAEYQRRVEALCGTHHALLRQAVLNRVEAGAKPYLLPLDFEHLTYPRLEQLEGLWRTYKDLFLQFFAEVDRLDPQHREGVHRHLRRWDKEGRLPIGLSLSVIQDVLHGRTTPDPEAGTTHPLPLHDA